MHFIIISMFWSLKENKFLSKLEILLGTHWYRARIVYFAQSIPASVFPGEPFAAPHDCRS